MQKKAIFLDRDGVLNHVILRDNQLHSPHSLDELVIPDDALSALTFLKSLGYLLIVATNQPDVANGKITRAAVEAIHALLKEKLPLDDIRVCYHNDSDACQCRKPRPGLLLSAADDHQINLAQSVMIGDRWRDIDAGRAAGCKTVWIDHHYPITTPHRFHPDFTAHSLQDAADWIHRSLSHR